MREEGLPCLQAPQPHSPPPCQPGPGHQLSSSSPHCRLLGVCTTSLWNPKKASWGVRNTICDAVSTRSLCHPDD